MIKTARVDGCFVICSGKRAFNFVIRVGDSFEIRALVVRDEDSCSYRESLKRKQRVEIRRIVNIIKK